MSQGMLEEYAEDNSYARVDTCNSMLTLKVPIMTAATANFAASFLIFDKTKVYYMRIVCNQTTLIKYHALFVIFEKAAKFPIVVCCKF